MTPAPRLRVALGTAAASLGLIAAAPSAASAAVTFSPDSQGNLTVSGGVNVVNDTIVVTIGGNRYRVNGVDTGIAPSPGRTITVDAGAGADVVDLQALTAADYRSSVMLGGSGADQLTGGAGADRLVGGPGGAPGTPEPIAGNAGNDVMVWNNGDGTDLVTGGDGADEVEVNGDPTQGDVFTLAPGADAGSVAFARNNLGPFGIDATVEKFTVNAQQGDDTITAAPGLAGRTLLALNGGNGADTITGGDGADLITGGEDADVLDGAGGTDRIVGDRGSDDVRGSDGDDTLVWNNGDGSDVQNGGAGSDRLEVNGAGAGDAFTLQPNGPRTRFDRTNLVPFFLDADVEQFAVNGLDGNDTVSVAPGTPTSLVADGGAGDDTLSGGDRSDALFGSTGNDVLDGGGGQDLVDGQDGDDRLTSRDGVGDLVRGGNGNDSAVTDRLSVDAVDAVEQVDATPEPPATVVTVPVASPPTVVRPVAPTLRRPKLTRSKSRLLVSIPVTCPRASGGCSLSALLSSPASVTRVRLPVIYGTGKLKLAAGKSGIIKVRLGRGAARLVKKRRLSVRTVVSSVDKAGLRSTRTRTDRLKLARSRRR